MQNFNDRLLGAVDHVVGKLSPLTALLDEVVARIAPQATAMAQYCPAFCGYECSGICGSDQQYQSEVCSYNYTGCDRGETWTNLLGCDC